MTYPVISTVPYIQEFYEHLRRDKGQSHNIAEMCALQCPPGKSGTDMAFNQGLQNNQQIDEWTPETRKHHLAKAKAAGVSISGKVYKASLASEPGDPKAWVSDLGDVARVVEEKAMDCDGMKSHRAPDAPPPVGPKLAEDIVQRTMAEYREQEHPESRRGYDNLRQYVIDKHGRPDHLDPS